jgi:hypothetical protein
VPGERRPPYTLRQMFLDLNLSSEQQITLYSLARTNHIDLIALITQMHKNYN